MDKLDDALGRLEESELLPEERLILNDRSKNDRKIDSILEDVVEILVDSETGDIRREFSRTQALLAKRRANLSSLKEKRISAPESGGFLKKSREELSEEIAEEESAIKEDEARLIDLERSMANRLKAEGLDASEEQIKGLLAGVTAEDITGMYAVYGNIRTFSEKLTELMEQGRDDISVARRYYGIYALLLRTCVVMNERFVEKIDGRYLPDLLAMEESASSLKEELSIQVDDRALSSRQRDLVRSNLESTYTTLEVIGAYRLFLGDQRERALSNLQAFRRDYSVAYNAYRTMKLAGGLLEMVKENRRDFDAVAKLEIPEVAIFSNDRLIKEFRSITEGLKR